MILHDRFLLKVLLTIVIYCSLLKKKKKYTYAEKNIYIPNCSWDSNSVSMTDVPALMQYEIFCQQSGDIWKLYFPAKQNNASSSNFILPYSSSYSEIGKIKTLDVTTVHSAYNMVLQQGWKEPREIKQPRGTPTKRAKLVMVSCITQWLMYSPNRKETPIHISSPYCFRSLSPLLKTLTFRMSCCVSCPVNVQIYYVKLPSFCGKEKVIHRFF